MLKFTCPKCGQNFEAEDNRAGSEVGCPCGTKFYVPANEKADTEAPGTISQNKSSLRETLIEMEPRDFKKVYTASLYLWQIGFLHFIPAFLFLLCGFFSLPILPAGILLGLIFFSLGFTFCYNRTIKAQKILRIIALLNLVFLVLNLVTIIFCINFLDLDMVTRSTSSVILFGDFIILLIWLFVYRSVKNKYLFSADALSHKQIARIQGWKEAKQPIEELNLPPDRIPGKLDKFFLYCSWGGVAFLILINLSIFFNSCIMSKDASDLMAEADKAFEARNYGQAFEYYRQAADRGDVNAWLNLGVCYAEGYGCEADLAKAYQCFSRNDTINVPVSQFYLGIMHFSGNGVNQDFVKAAEYLKKAADAGYEPAQKFLGYENGKMPDLGVSLSDALKAHFLELQKQK